MANADGRRNSTVGVDVADLRFGALNRVVGLRGYPGGGGVALNGLRALLRYWSRALGSVGCDYYDGTDALGLEVGRLYSS